MEIYRASFETRSFEFCAYSDTAAGATQTLKKVFKNHMKKTGGTYTWDEMEKCVYIKKITLNTGFVE